MLKLRKADNLGNYRISGLPGDSDRLITRKNLNDAKRFDTSLQKGKTLNGGFVGGYECSVGCEKAWAECEHAIPLALRPAF